MYEEFGAVVQDKQVEFKLFLPDNTVDSSANSQSSPSKGSDYL